MAQRVYPTNTNGKPAPQKLVNITVLDASLSGHVLEIHGDNAIFDTNTGLFVSPESLRFPHGATTVRFGLGAR